MTNDTIKNFSDDLDDREEEKKDIPAEEPDTLPLEDDDDPEGDGLEEYKEDNELEEA